MFSVLGFIYNPSSPRAFAYSRSLFFFLTKKKKTFDQKFELEFKGCLMRFRNAEFFSPPRTVNG